MFVRIVLLSIASLMLVQVGLRQFDAGAPFMSGDAAFDHASSASAAWQDDLGADLSASAESTGIAPRVSIRPHIVDLRASVKPRLRDAVWEADAALAAASRDATAHCTTALSCMQAFARSIDARLNADFAARFAALALAVGACLFALRAWWLRRIRDDLRELTAALRASTCCAASVTSTTSSASAPSAPPAFDSLRELHGLARALGDLLCRRSGAAQDRSTTFPAFLRQIETHAARLRAYAMNGARWNLRVALVEDIDLFQDLARQFADTAGGGANHAPVGVEAYLKDRFIYGANASDARIVLHLEAGDAFELPRTALVRLVDNLVGNALAHGAPPVEICTARGPRSWTLSVRDHGTGVGANLPDEGALAAPSLAARAASLGLGKHWGMGISIVRRLARLCNAKLKIGDHPEGGLWVRVIVPMDKAQRA
ncbi:ATP-binding protein [Paraburkholderia sp. J94]|uniref:ATP-binding protein n=1 Tax=Paraburkholderia sp. J94 TaxID=2805441 RepID=UPI002AAF7359|nr:ATP-binding protein [Paraburkholderia sp. J94]